MVPTSAFAFAILGFLVGSIPTSVLVGKILAGRDVREDGSGSAGATNVLRLLGWGPALFVAIVDIAKGALIVLLVPADPVWLPALCGSAAVLGHVWPVFAGFRGGKGVATATGVLLALVPWAGLAFALVFAATFAATRIASVASLLAVGVTPLVVVVLRSGLDVAVPYPALVVSFLLVPFLLFTHRDNLARLRRGTETRIGR